MTDLTDVKVGIANTQNEIKATRQDIKQVKDAVVDIIPMLIRWVVFPLVMVLGAAYGATNVVGVIF